jgi:integrase
VPQYRAVILTAAYTGLRAGELAALRVKNAHMSDLDPPARIAVRESVAEVDGVLH